MAFASIHAKERMKLRYGFYPTEAEWAKALLDILDGWSTKYSGYCDTNIEHHTVDVGGKIVPVVYSMDDALIITVLPWAALGQKGWKHHK